MGTLFVISSPSGGGKTTVIRLLLEYFENLTYSISATTRSARLGEEDAKDYFFMSEKEFLRKGKQKYFLETAEVFNHKYGTPRDYVLNKNKAGFDVILDIDVQGAIQIKKNYPAVLIFLLPPALPELRKRLKNRGLDTPDSIELRLKEAKAELKYVGKYDYVIPSADVETTFQTVKAIIQAEHCKSERNVDMCKSAVKNFY